MESKSLLVLGLDFETQDADAKTTRATEVGAALYEAAELKNGRLELQKIEGFSALMYEPDYPAQSEKIIELTGITDEMLKRDGRPRKEVFETKLLPLMANADIVLAHKTAFDRTVFEATCGLLDLSFPKDKEWICTLTNFPWPKRLTCHKLSHLAYEHGIMVDPRTLHRAEQDVDLMMRTVNEYDFRDVLAYAREPFVYLKADILGPWVGRGGDGGVQKEIATGLGFSWESVKGTDFPKWPKTWVGRVKKSKLEELMGKVRDSVSPFRVSVVEGI